MPQSLTIGLFVLGGVLLLIGILAGKFKIFGAEVAEKVEEPRIRWAAAILGLALIVTSISGYGQLDHKPVPPKPTPVPSSTLRPAPTLKEMPTESPEPTPKHSPTPRTLSNPIVLRTDESIGNNHLEISVQEFRIETPMDLFDQRKAVLKISICNVGNADTNCISSKSLQTNSAQKETQSYCDLKIWYTETDRRSLRWDAIRVGNGLKPGECWSAITKSYLSENDQTNYFWRNIGTFYAQLGNGKIDKATPSFK